MHSEHDPAVYLAALLDNIASIENYTAGLERDAFERDELTRDAVERCIARVCTALSRLGECAPALMRDQSWDDIAGVGDRLHHSCQPVEADLVWAVVQCDLQALKLAAALTLDRLGDGEGDG